MNNYTKYKSGDTMKAIFKSAILNPWNCLVSLTIPNQNSCINQIKTVDS